MAMSLAPRRFTSGTMESSSSLEPEYEMAMNTSPPSTMPRSPWLASAGCTKYAGVPVLDSVEAILRAMWPDLPMPLTITRPRRCRIRSSAATKRESSRSVSACTACASMASTLRASVSAEVARLSAFSSILVCAWRTAFIIGGEYSPRHWGYRPYGHDHDLPAIGADPPRERRARRGGVSQLAPAGDDRLRRHRARLGAACPWAGV